jgi:hypothetical protein
MSEEKKAPQRHTLALVVDLVAVLALSALMYFDKLDTATGVALIALIVGAKLPNRGGGGVVTMLAPVAGFLSNGHIR